MAENRAATARERYEKGNAATIVVALPEVAARFAMHS